MDSELSTQLLVGITTVIAVLLAAIAAGVSYPRSGQLTDSPRYRAVIDGFIRFVVGSFELILILVALMVAARLRPSFYLDVCVGLVLATLAIFIVSRTVFPLLSLAKIQRRRLWIAMPLLLAISLVPISGTLLVALAVSDIVVTQITK